jgi:hypothetical protein
MAIKLGCGCSDAIILIELPVGDTFLLLILLLLQL